MGGKNPKLACQTEFPLLMFPTLSLLSFQIFLFCALLCILSYVYTTTYVGITYVAHGVNPLSDISYTNVSANLASTLPPA